MKRTLLRSFAASFVALVSVAHGQGTAFTYQGRLLDAGSPASGLYDIKCSVFDSDIVTALLVAGPVTNSSVWASNGLFTITLDFGGSVFDGPSRWLEIAVRTNGAGTFSALSPRQRVAPTPYAITAGWVVSGGLAAGTYGSAVNFTNAANQFAGSGAALSNVNAATLGGVASSNYWQTGGNSGSSGSWYVGTADNQPFGLRVNKARGLQILPTWNGWPNLIAGSSNNNIFADATAASIGGGAWNDIQGKSGSASIGGGQRNVIGTNSAGSCIGGGHWNTLGDGSVRTVIAGGYGNFIGGTSGTNAGFISDTLTDGTSNTLLFGERNPGGGFIGGGTGNRIGRDCDGGVIAGGERNFIFGDGSVRTIASTIGGGVTNQIGVKAPCSVIDGGRRNVIEADAGASVIGGGGWNSIQQDGLFGTIGGGYANAIEGVSFVDGDATIRSLVDGTSNTILIGETNVASGVIGGGYKNRIGFDSSAACIGGGGENSIRSSAPYATIGGGRWNTNAGFGATIPGGARNYAGGAYSFASGRRARSIHDGSFVWADAQDADFASTAPNQFNVRADGSVRFITSGAGMTLDGQPVLAGSNGGALTNLNASALTSGTVTDARLSANVALRDAANVFTATQAIAGRLGIGTTSPQAPLQISTSTGEPSSLMLLSGGSWGLSLAQTPSSVMVISNGGQGRVFMPSSGNVGLGATNPLHKLHVGNYGTVSTINGASPKTVTENTNENGRAAYLAVAGPGSAASSTNRVEVAVEADEGQRIGLIGTMSDHPLQVRVSNSTRMFVNTNGNVGIGTTTPQQKLDVAGSVRIQVGPTTVLVNSDGTVSITSSTNITFSTAGDISLGARDISINAARNLSISGTNSASMNSSGAMNIHATSTLDMQGSLINLN